MGATSSRAMVEQWSVRYASGTVSLPDHLRIAMDQLYLCMRGIDEIEDHAELPTDVKVELLAALADGFRLNGAGIEDVLTTTDGLAEVTVRIPEWRALASSAIGPRIDEAMATLSTRLAYWTAREWEMLGERDLLIYCRDTACALLVLVDDLFGWGIGVKTDRSISVACGIGVQLGNILHGRNKDMERGVDFYPVGWTRADMRGFAEGHAAAIDAYISQFDHGPFSDWASAYFAGRY